MSKKENFKYIPTAQMITEGACNGKCNRCEGKNICWETADTKVVKTKQEALDLDKKEINYFGIILITFLIIFLALIISSDSVYIRANNNYYNYITYEGSRYSIKTLGNITEGENIYKEIIVKNKDNMTITVDILSSGYDYTNKKTFQCLKTTELETNKGYLLNTYYKDSEDSWRIDNIKISFTNSDIILLEFKI